MVVVVVVVVVRDTPGDYDEKSDPNLGGGVGVSSP